MRGIVAAALTGLALSGLVMVPGVARAEAPLETPGADSITFNRSEGRIGKAVLNDSGTDRTTVVADNSYFGIVPGMAVYNSSDTNQRSVAYRSGYAQDWLDADTATSGDYWSYVTRGVAWDYHLAAYYQYPYYGEYTPNAISTSTTSALGYKPNNPGMVPLNSTFLIGAVRHNNFPIYSQIHWVPSSFDIRIGDLEESFPFDQQETDNDTDTTAVRRKGGPYKRVSRASAPRTCPSTAPYYALGRSDGNWYCFQKVAEGQGNYDIYTDQPQYYPGSVGRPDQTPDSDDVLTITKTTSDQTITVNGIPYRLVLYGFVPNADGNCPATPPAGSTPVSTFTTKESQASFGCLYGSFSQERYVRVTKAVTEDSEQVGDAIPEFGFTTLGVGDWTGTTGKPLTTSVQADGFVAWNSFEDKNLTPTAYGEAGAVTSGYKAFMPGFSQFVIAETGPRIVGRTPLGFGQPGYFGPWKVSDDPNSAQWSLVDVTCLNGVGDDVELARGLLGFLRGRLFVRLFLDMLARGLGGLRFLVGAGGTRRGSQRHGAIAGRGEELGLNGGQIHGSGVHGRLRQLLAGLAAGAALMVRDVGVDEDAHGVDGHRGEGLDLVERATDADLASLDAVGGGDHPGHLVAVDDGGFERLPLAGVEGPGPDRVGPHLLGDLAGGAHAQLDVTQHGQVGLLACAVQEEGVALFGLNVRQPRLGVSTTPHHVGRRVCEVERNQRRTEGARDEHRALPAAQEASNLKHQLLPSLRGTRRAVSIDAGRTG